MKPAVCLLLALSASSACGPGTRRGEEKLAEDARSRESAARISSNIGAAAHASSTNPVGSSAPALGICAKGRDTVALRDGQLSFCTPGASERLLPISGDLSDPVLSPNGTHIAFVRMVGKERVPTNDGTTIEIPDARIALTDPTGSAPRDVARNGVCESLGRPLFVDERFLVVRAHGRAPTAGNMSVCLVDTKSGAVIVIASASHCAKPIRSGRHRGKILVGQSDFVVGQGYQGWFAIIGTDGKTVGQKLDENPFAIDLDGDGVTSDEERDAACGEPIDALAPPIARIEATL